MTTEKKTITVRLTEEDINILETMRTELKVTRSSLISFMIKGANFGYHYGAQNFLRKEDAHANR